MSAGPFLPRSQSMRTPLAIALGLAAFAPLLMFLAVPFTSGESFAMLATLTIAAAWLAGAAFVIYVLKTSAVPSDKRRLWVGLIVFGNVFVLPFFWFQYVWRYQRAANA
jgi:hypothetical protein